MPTRRVWVFVGGGALFYAFANQTQVGWVYVMAALLLSVVPLAWLLGAGAMRGLHAARTLTPANPNADADPAAPLVEGEGARVALTVGRARGWAAQLRLEETCPLAAPNDPASAQVAFAPWAGPGGVTLAYTVVAYKRGLWAFPPVRVHTRAPFGLFARHVLLHAPTRALVLPDVRVPSRLALLDQPLTEEMPTARPGWGGELLGVRPYRPGDSPRQIHARSTARTGRLVSKEFAQDAQPGLLLVLDRYSPWADEATRQPTPLEWALKGVLACAAYAHARRLPLYARADTIDWALPRGPLAWAALREATAKMPHRDAPGLAGALSVDGLPARFVVVGVAWPDASLAVPLAALVRGGARVLALLPDPATFPADEPTDTLPPVAPIAAAWRASGVDVCVLAYSAAHDWAAQISVYSESLLAPTPTAARP